MHKNIIIILLVLGAISCSKSRKYSGDYFCTVNGHFYELNSYNIDTTYQELLEVNREKKSINVLNRIIIGDSLKEGEWYFHSDYPSIFKIKIIQDSMYISMWSGGQGGGSSYYYSCQGK